ncbi:MAG: aa3-type cytochrome oxidase subunit CtaJ [Stackebrandtia sp.]
MTILQTVLVFVGIPVALYAVLAAMIYRPGSGSTKRYRPGREYDFAPIWFLARPEDVSVAAAADYVAAIPASSDAKAIEAGSTHSRTGVKGGASGSW